MTDAETLESLRNSARDLLARTGGIGRARAQRFGADGFCRATWKTMCESGWCGVALSETQGGSGLGMAGFCTIAYEMGRVLAPESLVPMASLVRLLPEPFRGPVLAGKRIVLPAWQQLPGTIKIGEAEQTGRPSFVNGRFQFVYCARAADAFVVRLGSGLAWVSADSPGVSVAYGMTHDGAHFGEVVLREALCTAFAGDLENVIEESALATSAYLLGAAEAAFDMTLAYVRTREQFGRVIGSFQALQHRLSDIKVQLELWRSAADDAANVWDSNSDPVAKRVAVSRVKARAADAAMMVTRQAVQLHGGIGFTDEYDIGLFLRKALVLSNAYGSAHVHRQRFAELACPVVNTPRIGIEE